MTKRRFRINAGRYGGETTVGEINPDFVEFVQGRDSDEIVEIVMAWEDSGDMEEYLSRTDGAPPLSSSGAEDLGRGWYEFDNLEHISSAYADGTWSWCEVPGDGSDDFAGGEEHEFEAWQICDREAYHSEELPEPTEYQSQEQIDGYVPVLAFHSAEKGGFGDYFVETNGEDFDPQLLTFSVLGTNVAEMVDRVWYNGVELEGNFDYADSWGKGYHASVGYFNPCYHDAVEKTVDNEEYMREIWSDYHRDLAEQRGENSQ